MPASRIRSAAQGYVELAGTARMMAGEPIIAPLSGLPCVWYRYSVEKTARSPDDDGLLDSDDGIEYGVSDGIFYLDDGTARCVVDPEGAEVRPSRQDSWRGRYRRPGSLAQTSPRLRHVTNRGPFRYTEARIHEGDYLCATGLFRTLGGDGFGDAGVQVSQLLSSWKKDPVWLVHRFDRNRDGSITFDEWEEAQRVAEVAVNDASAADGCDLYILAKPTDGRPFLLSSRPARRVIEDYSRHALVSASCLLVSSLAMAWLLILRLAVG